MKLTDKWGLIPEVPGDWVRLDDSIGWLPECPECGANEDQQCSFALEGDNLGIEVSTHVHTARMDLGELDA